MRLMGKVAVITGAGSGMGEETAKLFAREGATVVATDINLESVTHVVETIRSNGGEAIALQHDVTSRNDWENIYNEVQSVCGKLDVLVNNAGIALAKPFLDQTEEDWARTYRINRSQAWPVPVPIRPRKEPFGRSRKRRPSITGNTTFASTRSIRAIS